jgi:nitroimidazol reductase NimA-like FMN-containing flavoprotein (pyridoxamine 5'-phosphate oxidase superfamily)
MSDAESRTELEEIPEAECRELLARHTLGRVAITVDGQPQIFPVNYAIDDRVIVFRTAPGTKLASAPMSAVAFEIDEYDVATLAGWSVMAQGLAHEITDAVDRTSEVARSLPVSPVAPGEKEHWVAIHPSKVTGRRFSARAKPV